MQATKRYPFPDQLRGLAVVLMFVFHFGFDLTVFGYVVPSESGWPFWWLLPRVIVALFLSTVGISLVLAHHQHWRLRAFFKRLIKLSLAALAISLATYGLFPERWVYFGTLHCIALGSLVALPLSRHPLLAGGLGLAILFGHFGLKLPLSWWRLEHASMDYIPLWPWLSAILIGQGLAGLGLQRLKLPSGRVARALSWLGQHSLILYLLHQPVFFGLIAAFSWVLSNRS